MDILSLLPIELSREVLSYFTAKELGTISPVSKHWKELSEDKSLWKPIYDQLNQPREVGEVNWKEKCLQVLLSLDTIIDLYRQVSDIQKNLNVEGCLELFKASSQEIVRLKSQIAFLKTFHPSHDFSLRIIRHMCGEERYDDAPCVNVEGDVLTLDNPGKYFSHPLTKGTQKDGCRFIVAKNESYYHLFIETSTKASWLFYPNRQTMHKAVLIDGDELVDVDLYLKMRNLISVKMSSRFLRD